MKRTDEKLLRTVLRLSEIERILRKERLIVPPPSRRTLIAYCEEGIFETAGNGPSKMGWLVYEDSFLKWVRSLH